MIFFREKNIFTFQFKFSVQSWLSESILTITTNLEKLEFSSAFHFYFNETTQEKIREDWNNFTFGWKKLNTFRKKMTVLTISSS